MRQATFFSCDWGTSSFRLRLVEMQSGRIIAASAAADDGIAAVYQRWQETAKDENERVSFYLRIILWHMEKIAGESSCEYAGVPVVVSGMASSSIGMMEMPYAMMPISMAGEGLYYRQVEKSPQFPADLLIISGVRTATDVMRGEETQLLGCVSNPAYHTALFIFPGTHSKHVTVEKGQAVNIVTFMTGEFFDLLANNSILRNSVSRPGLPATEDDLLAFEAGVRYSEAHNILQGSFQVRVQQLFKTLSATANYYYLSGLLIGKELGGLRIKAPDAIVIIGDDSLAERYIHALKIFDIQVPVSVTSTITATVLGQRKIYQRFCEGID